MALTPEQAARLAELEAKFGGMEAPKSFATPAEGPKPGIDALGAPGRFLVGAGRKIAETGPLPLARFLADRGVPGAGRVVQNYEADVEQNPAGQAGDIGGVAMDAAMLMAPTPFGKMGPAARVLGSAAQGTAQHQAQNYGKEGEFRPGEAVGEMALSTLLPGAFKGLQKGAGATAKNIMRWVVQPTAKMKNPNLEPAMASAKGLGKYFEGLPGLAKRMGKQVGEAGADKAKALEDAGFVGKRGKAMIRAVKEIDSRRPEMGPMKGLNAPEREEAIAGVNRWAEPTSNLSPRETMSLLSKVYDDAYKSGKDINLAGRERGAREFGKQLRGQMDEHMESAAPLDLARYTKASEDYRTFEPIRQAVNHRLEVPAVRKPALSRIWVAGDIIDPLVYRPGTANMLYDIANPSKGGKAIGRGMLNLGRAAYYGDSE